MQKHSRTKITAVLLTLFMIMSACGYRLTPVGGVVPEQARTIAIPVFQNGTNEPYLDTLLTQATVEEFLADGRLKVVVPDDADLILRCRITKFDMTPTAYTANSYVQTYNLGVTLNLTLEDTKTRKILLTEKNLNLLFISSYPVTLGDIAATKIAKEGALRNASKDIASTIRSKVLEGF